MASGNILAIHWEIHFPVSLENFKADGFLTINCFFKGNHSRKWSLYDLFKTYLSLATLTGRHGCRNFHRSEIYQCVENKMSILTGSEKCFYTSCRYQLHVLCLFSLYIQQVDFTTAPHCSLCYVLCELMTPKLPIVYLPKQRTCLCV